MKQDEESLSSRMEASLVDYAMFISETDELDGQVFKEAKKRGVLNPISILYDNQAFLKLSPEDPSESVTSSKATIKSKDDMQNISLRFSFNDAYMINGIMKRTLKQLNQVS